MHTKTNKNMNWRSFCFWIVLVGAAFLASKVQAQNEKVLMCYWGGWSVKREYPGNFTIQNFDATLCTHILFAFAIPIEDGTIGDTDGSAVHYNALVAKKKENPDLKVLLAIGGVSGGAAFSKMAADPTVRTRFVNNAKTKMTGYGFDGIDMDWEYPNGPGDKENFAALLEEMRKAFDGMVPPKLLTAAVGVGPETIAESYDIPNITQSLHYINLMAYDLKSYIPGCCEYIGHHAPLHTNPQFDTEYQTKLTMEWIVQTFIESGADPHKLVLGVGTYGHTYTMESREKHNFMDTAVGPGTQGPWTLGPGIIAYSEICYQIPLSTSRWEFHFDPLYQVPYAFNDVDWIGFDDEESAVLKVDFAMTHELGTLGGMMIWSIEQDDCNNFCDGWYPCPIISAVKRRLDYYRQ